MKEMYQKSQNPLQWQNVCVVLQNTLKLNDWILQNSYYTWKCLKPKWFHYFHYSITVYFFSIYKISAKYSWKLLIHLHSLPYSKLIYQCIAFGYFLGQKPVIRTGDLRSPFFQNATKSHLGYFSCICCYIGYIYTALTVLLLIVNTEVIVPASLNTL